jgi:DNA-binding response OmpR family regulator
MKKILLVEDDPSLGFVIHDNLTLKGYDVVLCTNGDQGYTTFTKINFDLCILDVMLPRKDGFTLAQDIRAINKDVPVIFLTAKGMTEDKLAGFSIGGDDYITKPFNLEELLCRMEVFLKRNMVNDKDIEQKIFAIGAFEFDYANLTLQNKAGRKTLTQKEAEVLRLLHLNKGRVLKREEILKHVWGDDDYFMGRSMDVFISKLRKYLRDDTAVQIINYHGVGFKLEDSGR